MLGTVRHRLLPFTVRLVLVAAVVLVAGASPATADPAGPGDYRSEVTGIVPAVDGVRAEVRGGDAFLELSVDEGHEAIVEGYRGEPYLRFREDGVVERNRLATATYVNDDRKGRGTVPAEVEEATATTPPEWEQVGDGGTYAWHDHRMHWMGGADPGVPRGSEVGGAYDPWKIPIEVDGAAATIEGTLIYEDGTSPLPWVALALVLGGALAWFGRGRTTVLVPAALTALAAVALVVGRADFTSTPGGANALQWALPTVALVTAVVGLLPFTRRFALVGALASVATLSAWSLFRLDVLTNPVLPTDLPFWLDRVTTALSITISVAAAYLTVTSGQLKFAELPDD
jgi:hypothetical protein